MAIKKTEAGWQVDIQPGGRGGKRFRKSFPTKLEAKQWENWVKAKTLKNPDWQPERKDIRKLSELIDLWYQLYGKSLKSKNTYSRLKWLCKGLGDPIASELTAEQFARYRELRLSTGTSANTVNREHAYLRSVINELKRLGHWKGDNPLTKVRRLKIDEKELSFLTIEQIQELLRELNQTASKDVVLVVKICLSTGARWGEAVGLRLSQVGPGYIQFTETKNGKRRTVPICAQLEREIREHAATVRRGKLFTNCLSTFRRVLERTSISLPRGQQTHVLRHTFASHFMMRGGNILALQKILGHHSLTMTMRYAHLSPDHLEEAKKLNPLTALTLG